MTLSHLSMISIFFLSSAQWHLGVGLLISPFSSSLQWCCGGGFTSQISLLSLRLCSGVVVVGSRWLGFR